MGSVVPKCFSLSTNWAGVDWHPWSLSPERRSVPIPGCKLRAEPAWKIIKPHRVTGVLPKNDGVLTILATIVLRTCTCVFFPNIDAKHSGITLHQCMGRVAFATLYVTRKESRAIQPKDPRPGAPKSHVLVLCTGLVVSQDVSEAQAMRSTCDASILVLFSGTKFSDVMSRPF